MKLLSFFTKLKDTYTKGLKFDVLELEYVDLTAKYGVLDSDYLEILGVLKELNDRFSSVSKSYKKLLSKGKIDVLDVKNWYETKYGNTPYIYNYDGKGAKDIRSALRTTQKGKLLMETASKELIKKYNLVTSSNPSKIVESVIKYFSKSTAWTYAFDKDQFKRNEYWELAEKSWLTRQGDCDDLAILMHVLTFYIFKKLNMTEHYWRIKLAIGEVLQYGGHAFNIWLHEDGEWYVVESTYDLKGSFKRTWLKTPIKYNNFYVRLWGFARKDRSWTANIKALDKYKKGE